MSGNRLLAAAICAGAVFGGIAGSTRADDVEPPALPTQVEVPAPEVDTILSRGDNAWMLVARRWC